MTDEQVRNIEPGQHIQYACKHCSSPREGTIKGVISRGRTSDKPSYSWARVILEGGSSLLIESDEYIRHFGRETHNRDGKRINGVEIFPSFSYTGF